MAKRVFIIQEPVKRNSKTGSFRPKFDMRSAEKFGTFVYLLSPVCDPSNPEETIAQLRKKLQGFCNDDALLLVGNPCFIGWATAIASDINDGQVRMLQWSGHSKNYFEVSCDGLIDFGE